MAKRRRGRPPGTSGRAAVLSAPQARTAFRLARSRGRHAERAETALALSIGLGLSAKELAGLKWADVFDADGRVRDVMNLRAAYTKGVARATSSCHRRAPPRLQRYGESYWLMSAGTSKASLLPSQKGGPMTASSMARFLKALYREAGIAGASSHSGRRTLITRLAERGVDLKAIAQIAGHTSLRTTAMYVESNPTRLARMLQDVTF